MKAVYIKNYGGPEGLEIREVPDPPAPTGTQILVGVKASALNRADLLQRRGLYRAPEGFSQEIPGLEFAGEIIKTGEAVTDFRPGDRVFGIAAGGAQAEFFVTEQSLLAHIPENLTFTEAAAIPEAFITAHDALFTQAQLKAGETLLIHAVGSGVGLAALQLAKARGVRVFGTSRTASKLDAARELGLDEALLTGEDADFSGIISEKTDGRGVDVILDLAGAGYFSQNLASLALKGRLMLVGLTAGRKAEFDLGIALHKRLTIIGTVLRGRITGEKAAATRAFIDDVMPLIADGTIKPDIDKIFGYQDVREAHEYLESNKSFGKVVLEFGE